MSAPRPEQIPVVRLTPEDFSLQANRLAIWTEQATERLEGAPTPYMVLDCSRIDYLNSTVLEAISKLWQRIRRRHGELALVGLTEFCHDVIRTTRLDTLWTIYPDMETALRQWPAVAAAIE